MTQEKGIDDNEVNSESAFQKYRDLVNRISKDATLQPADRNNDGFYTTKNLFLEERASVKVHKLWRDRGMHKYMKQELLEMYTNLNPHMEGFPIEKTILDKYFTKGMLYPDITWEDLECHAAKRKINEILAKEEDNSSNGRDKDVKNNGDGRDSERQLQAPKKEGATKILSVDDVVKIRKERDPNYTIEDTRATLLRHCRNLRKKRKERWFELPHKLYENRSNLSDIELHSIPEKGSHFRFLQVVDE